MSLIWASERFRWSELACPCGECGGLPVDRTPLEATARWLQEVERALGTHYDLTLVSVYRCAAYDLDVEEAGPVEDLHTRGLAADVVCRTLSPGQLQRHLVPLTELVPHMLSHRGVAHIGRAPAPAVRWRP